MTFYQFSKIAGFLSPIILIVGIILGLYFYKRINMFYKSIAIYLMLMLGVDLSARILPYYGNNLIILPIFSLVEMSFFVYFYNKHLLKKVNPVLVILGAIAAIYIIVEMLRFFVFNVVDAKQFQPYAKVADNFMVIVMALFFFYQKINSFNETKWGNFKLNTVLLAYFTFNTIIFLPFNFMINESSGVKFYFWTINIVMVILFYLYLISLIYRNSRENLEFVKK